MNSRPPTQVSVVTSKKTETPASNLVFPKRSFSSPNVIRAPQRPGAPAQAKELSPIAEAGILAETELSVVKLLG